MSIIFENANILAMVGGRDFLNHHSLRVEKGKIAEIGPVIPHRDGDEIIDCQDAILMPGLKNAHTHSAMSFLVDFAPNLSLQEWLNRVWLIEDKLTQEDVYWFSQKSFLEYTQGGTTACFDMYYFSPFISKACEDFGMRGNILMTMGDHGERVLTFEKLLEQNHKGSLVKYSAGLHAEYTAGKEELEAVKQVIKKHRLPFFTHNSETKLEVEECIQRHGVTPTVFLEQEGLYDYGGGGYHCVHLSDSDIAIFIKHNLTVVSCPGSNLYLGSGVAPLQKYHELGINIALGTDSPSSNENLSMWREMNLVHQQNPSFDSYEIVKMATVNSSKALGFEETSSLEVGKAADLILVNASSVDELVSNFPYSRVISTYINERKPNPDTRTIEKEFLRRKEKLLQQDS